MYRPNCRVDEEIRSGVNSKGLELEMRVCGNCVGLDTIALLLMKAKLFQVTSKTSWDGLDCSSIEFVLILGAVLDAGKAPLTTRIYSKQIVQRK